jgi:signal transduction histidine kinase
MILHDLAGELGSDQKMQLNRLKRAAMQLGTLVDDLLQYAKLAQLQPSRVAIDLSDLANEVVGHVRTRESCGANIEISVQPGLEAVADPAMLRLVLENLIDNACKYSRGVDKPRVTVGRDEDGYFVRDNGDGFDMQYYEKLFKPFERLHRDETIPGTGIGLANAKRIVERHGGRIWAVSSPGEGATFYFTLGPASAEPAAVGR